MKDGSVARQIKNICILVMEMRYLKDDKYRNIGGMSSDILHTLTYRTYSKQRSTSYSTIAAEADSQTFVLMVIKNW